MLQRPSSKPSRQAERTRRSRQRRRQGLSSFRVDVHDRVIEALLVCDPPLCLSDEESRDRRRVERALSSVLEYWARRWVEQIRNACHPPAVRFAYDARMTYQRPVLVPEDRLSRSSVLVRAAVAHLVAFRKEWDPSALAAKTWQRDSAVAEIIKGAVSPATLTSASALTQTAVADFFVSLAAASAAAAVLDRSVKVSFDSYASVLVPGIVSDASNCTFIAEGAAIPVRSFNLAGPRLDPRKLMTLCTFTNEVLDRSIPDVETIVRRVLVESVGLALDSYLFDDAAGDAVRPGGLRYGIAALTASAATDPAAAMRADVAALLAAVGRVGGNAPAMIIAGLRCAASLRLMLAPANPGFEVLASGALADGLVLCVAPSALAYAVDRAPEFTVSRETLVHEDTAPSPIGAGGVVASPARSIFQTDATSLRMRLFASWGVRSPLGVAWLTASW